MATTTAYYVSYCMSACSACVYLYQPLFTRGLSSNDIEKKLTENRSRDLRDERRHLHLKSRTFSPTYTKLRDPLSDGLSQTPVSVLGFFNPKAIYLIAIAFYMFILNLYA